MNLEQQTAKQSLDAIAVSPFELTHLRQGLGGLGERGLKPAKGSVDERKLSRSTISIWDM